MRWRWPSLQGDAYSHALRELEAHVPRRVARAFSRFSMRAAREVLRVDNISMRLLASLREPVWAWTDICGFV